MWELIDKLIDSAPPLLQELVAMALGACVILLPVGLVVFIIVLSVKDVSLGPLHVSSKKRTAKRAKAGGRRSGDR